MGRTGKRSSAPLKKMKLKNEAQTRRQLWTEMDGYRNNQKTKTLGREGTVYKSFISAAFAWSCGLPPI